MFGVLNLEKPLHYTSHDVIARVRRKLGLKKVGHSGTLDPLATGVLPVFIGQATRLIEFMPDDKRYHAEITFGRATTTWDAEGETVQAHDASTITLETLLPLLDGFRGDDFATGPPPMRPSMFRVKSFMNMRAKALPSNYRSAPRKFMG